MRVVQTRAQLVGAQDAPGCKAMRLRLLPGAKRGRLQTRPAGLVVLIMCVIAASPSQALTRGQNPCHDKLQECLRGCGGDPGCERYCLQRLGCLPGPGVNLGGSATSTMKKNGGSTGLTKPPVPKGAPPTGVKQ
jgi:hypothetical protein